MTDNIENRKVSISFARKISDGNYGTREATAWVQGDVAPDAPLAQVHTLLTDLFLTGQSAVLDQLGIEYDIDPETGVVVEKQAPAVTSADAAKAMVEKQFGPVTEVSGGDIRIMNPDESVGPLPDWLVSACRRDGVTAVWDQRHKATGKQPHFKEAVARGATGKGKDGMAKGYWPPR